jgi:diacylglycerol kinase (ATP)
MRTVAIVYNPIKVQLDDLKAAVDAEPQSAGCEVLWLPTSEDDPGQGPAQKALDAGATVVIAAGGDGTVRAVAEVVRGSDAALALLPSGTGNLLARNLTLTLDSVADSLATAFGPGERTIDVADIEIRRQGDAVDKHLFLVMAGAGLDAKIMSNTDDELKKKVGWIAYAQAMVTVMKDKDALRLTYKIDAKRNRSERAQTIVIGNCGSLPANILLLPDAVVDDGLLDVIVVKPESIRGWLAVTFKILWENGVVRRTRFGKRMTMLKSASIDMRQGKSIVVTLNKPEIVELDGDPFGEMIGCRITVDPRSLSVKVPVVA